MKALTIAIDFDGTIVTHEYPEIGVPVPGAIDVILKLQERGHRLMLWTMRSGSSLLAAVDYLKSHGVMLYGINENPGQRSWSSSNKQFAHVYIDDAALGCPLVYGKSVRPFVDWSKVEINLKEMGVL